MRICHSAPRMHHGYDAGARGAKGHADADLAGAAGNEVGHDAVEANRSENQCQDAKQAGEPRDRRS